MRYLRRLGFSNVVATLALFFALSGTAVAGAHLWITGANVKNHSLTGADIKSGSLTGVVVKNHSLTGADVKNGSFGESVLTPNARKTLLGHGGSQGPEGPAGPQGTAGATGPQGPAGAGTTTATVTGSDQSNYVDLSPIATYALPVGNVDYVIVTRLTAHNSGPVDDYLNCGYELGGVTSPTAGVQAAAGATVTGSAAGVVNADTPGTVKFFCQGSGTTTFDISNVQMRIHLLG